MPNVIDSEGFKRVRFQELRSEKAQEYKDAFGNQELKTDVQSGVGQEISISTFAEDDLAARFQALISTFDPSAAQGVYLSRLALLMNKRRQDATPSSVTLEITATSAGGTAPAGFKVSNTAGDAEFETVSDLPLAPSSTGTVEAVAIADGPITAIAGSLTVIKTPVFGIVSVTNPQDASVGRNRETDVELRPRMLASSSAASSTVIGIRSALSNVDGVVALEVLENKTLAASAEGIPAKSVFPIVDGGADSDVAKALIIGGVAGGIGYAEPADIPAANIVSGDYTDPTSGQVHTAYWSRPVDLRGYVDVTLNKLSDYPADGDVRVADSIESWVLAGAEFGEDLYASQLYTPIQEIPGAVVVSVTVGTSPSPVDSVLVVDVYERASVAAGDVVIS